MRSVLSARQEECLRLTAFRTDREIAAVLGISEATVKKHVHEACHRLGVKRRKAALALLAPGEPTLAGAPVAPVAASPVVAPMPQARPANPMSSGARLGYRPPPRNAAARVVMIAGLAVVLVATTTTLTHMVGDYHRAIGRLDAPVAALAVPKTVGNAVVRD